MSSISVCTKISRLKKSKWFVISRLRQDWESSSRELGRLKDRHLEQAVKYSRALEDQGKASARERELLNQVGWLGAARVKEKYIFVIFLLVLLSLQLLLSVLNYCCRWYKGSVCFDTACCHACNKNTNYSRKPIQDVRRPEKAANKSPRGTETALSGV